MRATDVPASAYAVVAVSLAVAGHTLGRGDLPDPLALLAALGAALALGAWAQRTGAWWRVLLGLVLVQPLVHLLGRHGAPDARLDGAATHAVGEHALGHAHAVAGQMGSGATTAMLIWHALAVPLAALALIGVRRSLVALAALLRRLHVATPVPIPAPAPVRVVLAAPVLARPRHHLVVRRGNAPPCWV